MVAHDARVPLPRQTLLEGIAGRLGLCAVSHGRELTGLVSEVALIIAGQLRDPERELLSLRLPLPLVMALRHGTIDHDSTPWEDAGRLSLAFHLTQEQALEALEIVCEVMLRHATPEARHHLINHLSTDWSAWLSAVCRRHAMVLPLARRLHEPVQGAGIRRQGSGHVPDFGRRAPGIG